MSIKSARDSNQIIVENKIDYLARSLESQDVPPDPGNLDSQNFEALLASP